MKNNTSIYLVLSLLSLAFPSCRGAYDDGALKERLESLEQRAAILEDRCNRINTNIAALQGLVNVSASSDRIKSIVPLTENGVVTGYTFYFCYADPVTVFCAHDGTDGKDGKDGHNGTPGRDGEDGEVPLVGVREVGGVYFWTLDGEFILDENGEKIPLVTTGGAVVDGRTPRLKVENGVWYYRMDDDEPWTPLEVVSVYGDGNIFSSVIQDGDNVVFNLSDGSSISVPKIKTMSLNLTPSAEQAIAAGTTVRLEWSVTTEDENVEVDAFAEGRWTATVERTGSGLSGNLVVTAPADASGTCLVVLFATASDGLSEYKTIKFTVL